MNFPKFEKIAALLGRKKKIHNYIKDIVGIYPRLHKLPDRYMPGVVPDLLQPFELVGDNWCSSEELPIAIFWGFNPWKRPFMQAWFPDHKLAFVRGARGFLHLDKLIRHFPPHRGILLVGWGLKLPNYAARYASNGKIPTCYVEDGFLRSFHPGALHTKPWSLTFDSRAPYYDTRNKTDLQVLLSKREQERLDAEQHKLAEAGLALVRAARLTKYFSLRIGDEEWTPPPMLGRKLILVIGQVEDDAAILKGYSSGVGRSKFSNLAVIQRAARDHPDACILYRPHPDTFHNDRKSRHEKEIASLCSIIEPTVPLQAVFPHVQQVYTGTSLAGFEAALWGIPVTTLGLPFYAASPAIKHLQGDEAGFARLDLPELFSVLYLEYPRYIHPDSDETATFFDLASYFIVEKFMHFVLDGIPEGSLDLKAMHSYELHLSPPAKLFLYLLSLGRTGKECSNKILALAGDPLRYQDIPQFSELLIKACRFDMLAVYFEKSVTQFARDMESLKRRKSLLIRLLQAFNENQKALRGRVSMTLPDIADWVAPRVHEGYIIPDDLLLAYARALSNNLQYDILEHVVANMEICSQRSALAYGVAVLSGFAALLIDKPARSERNGNKRAQLLDRVGRLYYERLLAEPDMSPILARALTDIAVDRPHAVKEACEEILYRISTEKEQGGSQILTDFHKRTPSILNIVKYLTRHSQHELVDRLLEHLDDNDSRVQLQKLRNLIEREEFTAFHAFYAHIPEDMKARAEVNDLYTRAQIAEGEFQAALETVHKNLALATISRKKRALLYEQRGKLEFSLEASRILDSVPQPQVPKGVVFLGTFSDHKAVAVLVPVLREVRRRGYAVVSLINGVLRQTPTGFPNVDQFQGAISTSTITRKTEYRNEWNVNWSKKIVSSGGINYYQGFYEALSNFFRVYDVDLNDEAIRRNFFYRLVRADDCLDVCNRILRDVARAGLPSILLSGDGHVVPYSIFRDFCGAAGHPGLSYVNVSIGYENYFSNLSGRYSSTMTVGDMTLFTKQRAPFLARADRFERWYAREKGNPAFSERANELINFNRVHQEGDEVSRALTAYLAQERANGRKIIACLGKIPIDLGVPYDGGPGHEDLRDWLNHTIETVQGHDDVLLIIKPHPHELQPSIALDLVDRFTDLIRGPLPENVRILGHREINNHQLAPHLDLALMWNGSSAMELTALGIPVMMAGHFARYDYPVEVLYPKDRDHYRAFIQGKNWPTPDEETRRQAAYLISYMETSDVTIRNDYAWRPVTNDSAGTPTFRKSRVEELMRKGDPEMERAASRILERFEGVCN